MDPALNPNRRRWPRVLAWCGAAVFVSAVAGLIGARWWLGRYLHGEPFRQLISQQTAAALHATGEYLPLHWTGNSVYSDGFYARGHDGSRLQELRADQIRAEIELDGLLQPTWRVSQIDIQRVRVALAPAVVAGHAPGTKGKALPVGPIRIEELTINGIARRVQAVIEFSDGAWQARGSGGDVTMPGWPDIKIEQVRLRERDGTMFITDSQFRLADGGTVTVNGQVPASGGLDLQIQFAGVPAKNWVPPDWRGSIAGWGTGKTTLRQHEGKLAATGNVTLDRGKIEALPVLDRIALFTRTAQFRSVELTKASAEFAWGDTQLIVRKLLLESAGLLRIEGGCVISNGTMDGQFDVGVAGKALEWLPGSRTRVFTVERDGYLWTKVRVRGPLRALQEDLSVRLIEAAGTEMIDSVGQTLEKGAQQFLDLLKKPLPF